MKLFLISLLAIGITADRLENTYLPPNSAKTAGGNGNFIQAPFSQNNLNYKDNQGTPNNYYRAPEAFNRDQSQPSRSYGAPTTKYGAPTQSTKQYNNPSNQYGAPINRPETQYGGPVNQPSNQYGSPINRPETQYGAPLNRPETQYGTPINRPESQYGAPLSRPETQYGTAFNRPESQYGAPLNRQENKYEARNNQLDTKYDAPNNRPTNNYGTPNESTFQKFQEYNGDAKFNQQSSPVYSAPQQSNVNNYEAPSPVYGGPKSAEARANILRSNNENNGDGSYRFEYETENQISQQEVGELKNAGTENEASSVQGTYSYMGTDGILYTVEYIADENGFRAKGDHIPTTPAPVTSENNGYDNSRNEVGYQAQRNYNDNEGRFNDQNQYQREQVESRQYLAPNQGGFNQNNGYRY